MRRAPILVLTIGLVAALAATVPATASSGSEKLAPAMRVYAYANDDGLAGTLDPGDIGDISASYDRWGTQSSDDPSEPGMDPNRLDGDVARCRALRLDEQTMRMRIENAYPGYTCTFTLVTISRVGFTLVLDDIRISVDPTLELTTIDGPEIGDELKRRRKLYGTYAVEVLQEAPQGETLEFDIQFDFAYPGRRATSPKSCLRCSDRI